MKTEPIKNNTRVQIRMWFSSSLSFHKRRSTLFECICDYIKRKGGFTV